jgi:hypothetical protein
MKIGRPTVLTPAVIKEIAELFLLAFEQRLCFHFTNLQPLFASENHRKHAKWEGKAA